MCKCWMAPTVMFGPARSHAHLGPIILLYYQYSPHLNECCSTTIYLHTTYDHSKFSAGDVLQTSAPEQILKDVTSCE